MDSPVHLSPATNEAEAVTTAQAAPAAVTNPTHGSNSNHPPYAEMIAAAITALNEKDGSSKQAITKYISRVYPNLPTTHSALMTHHLQRLKTSGELVMVNRSYQLAAARSAIPINNAPPSSLATSLSVRKRGRPAKTNTAVSEPVREPPKKRPGRRPRVKAGLDGNVAKPDGQFHGSNLVVDLALKRKPGRPARSRSVSGVMEQTVSPINDPTVPVAIPFEEPSKLPKPKGRPKRNVAVSQVKALRRPQRNAQKNANAAVGGGNAGKVVAGKRRGRPSLKAAMYNAGNIMEPVVPQLMVHYAHVNARLQHVQGKMKKAIEVLRPQLINRSMANPDVVAALRELDGIAKMDMMGAPLDIQLPAAVAKSPKVQRQLPTPSAPQNQEASTLLEGNLLR